jgi:hypothetical protein
MFYKHGFKSVSRQNVKDMGRGINAGAANVAANAGVKNRCFEFNTAMKQIADYLFIAGQKSSYVLISELARKSGVRPIKCFVHFFNFKSFESFQHGSAKSAIYDDDDAPGLENNERPRRE